MRSIKFALVLTLLMGTVTMASHAQVQVFVPGNASGYFGNYADKKVPFVPAITVDGPGTITVIYISGKVSPGGGYVGPNGGYTSNDSNQSPLEEAKGVAPHKIGKVGALIGAFVPQSRAEREGFKAIDGTKNATRFGIKPSSLFFVGKGITLEVTEAGTLFLGINDWVVADNSGGFTVEVTGP